MLAAPVAAGWEPCVEWAWVLACDEWLSGGTVGWKVKLRVYHVFPEGQGVMAMSPAASLSGPVERGVSKEHRSRSWAGQAGSGQACWLLLVPPQASPSPPLLPRVQPGLSCTSQPLLTACWGGRGTVMLACSWV